MSLEYTSHGHIYELDGQRIPCVSDLCHFLNREIYAAAPVWQMEAAAERGTAVHSATESLDRIGTAEIEDEYSPYLEAYASFLREHSVSWELIEHSDYHPTYLYAGTIDRYGTLDGAPTLLDIKTTYTVHKPLCIASLNLYRMILESRGMPVEQLAILHLRKNGAYKIVLIEIRDDVPLALLTLQELLKKRRRKNGRNQERSQP